MKLRNTGTRCKEGCGTRCTGGSGATRGESGAPAPQQPRYRHSRQAARPRPGHPRPPRNCHGALLPPGGPAEYHSPVRVRYWGNWVLGGCPGSSLGSGCRPPPSRGRLGLCVVAVTSLHFAPTKTRASSQGPGNPPCHQGRTHCKHTAVNGIALKAVLGALTPSAKLHLYPMSSLCPISPPLVQKRSRYPAMGSAPIFPSINTAAAFPEINPGQQSSFLPGVGTGYCYKHSGNTEVSPSHAMSLVEIAWVQGHCLVQRHQDS